MYSISQGLLLGMIYLQEFFLFLTNGVSNNSSLHERRLYRVRSLSWLSYKYRTVRQVFDRLIAPHNSLATCSNMCLQEYTLKPRYNEGHSYWQKICFNKNSLNRGSFPYILLFQEYRSFSRVLRYLEVRYMEVSLYINEITVLCFSNTIKSNVDSILFYLALFLLKYILEPCISKGWSLTFRARLYRELVRLELLHIFYFLWTDLHVTYAKSDLPAEILSIVLKLKTLKQIIKGKRDSPANTPVCSVCDWVHSKKKKNAV